jgi:hypothetical protein
MLGFASASSYDHYKQSNEQRECRYFAFNDHMQVKNGNFTRHIGIGIATWENCERTTWPEETRNASRDGRPTPTLWESCGEIITKHGIIGRGLYDEQFDYWRASYDEEAFCLLSSDALRANTTSAVRRIAAFAGLRPSGAWAEETEGHKQKGNAVTHTPADLSSEADAVERLREFYKSRSKTYTRLVDSGGWLNCE